MLSEYGAQEREWDYSILYSCRKSGAVLCDHCLLYLLLNILHQASRDHGSGSPALRGFATLQHLLMSKSLISAMNCSMPKKYDQWSATIEYISVDPCPGPCKHRLLRQHRAQTYKRKVTSNDQWAGSPLYSGLVLS